MPTTRTLILALIVGCGSGVQGHVPRCQPGAPRASSTGTVAGAALAPVRIACASADTDRYSIVLASGSDTCPAQAQGADTLDLRFCTTTAPRTGDYPVAPGPLDCPGDPTAEALVGGTLHTGLLAGSITITDDQVDCLAGTFDLSFSPNDTLTGDFAAVKL